MSCFNSRTLGRVRLTFQNLQKMKSWFQFTHPGKGAIEYTLVDFHLPSRFQFTHPGKGATMGATTAP